MIIVLGLILGFRPSKGVPGVLAALGLVIVFSFSLSWVFTTRGLLMRSPNAVMNAGFMSLFPIVFRAGDGGCVDRRIRATDLAALPHAQLTLHIADAVAFKLLAQMDD